MAQIVIDIDDKTYKAFMELISINLGRSNYKGIIEKCLGAIKHGKVLPKGHGRLIDADYKVSSDGRTIESVCGYIAPTIIEADKGEVRDKE